MLYTLSITNLSTMIAQILNHRYHMNKINLGLYMNQSTREKALQYHRTAPSGKLSTQITKPVESSEDLSLAYTPGVGACVEAICADPDQAYELTNISHTCAIVSNATAVLGYGQTSPRAAKPVMEGKAALIKHMTDLDAIDLVVDELNPDKFVDLICQIAPSFGAIMLEDIKAPDCFHIEEKLAERCPVPFFHDDQHGTAIVVAAALINAMKVQNQSITDSHVCLIGAGAAGYAIYQLLIALGFTSSQIIVIDREGPLATEKTPLSIYKQRLVNTTFKGDMQDALSQSQIVIGVAKGDLLTEKDILSLPAQSILFALSNPTPEISPDIVAKLRPDILMATGRSDFPNQVNNVLVFPYLIKAMVDSKNLTLDSELKVKIATYLASLIDAEKDKILPGSFDSRLHKIVDLCLATADSVA